MTGGSPSSSKVRTLKGIARNAPATAPRCMKEVGAEAREVLHAEREIELVVLLERDLLLFGQDRVAEVLGLDRGRAAAAGAASPSRRCAAAERRPVVMCMSLAPLSIMALSSCWRLTREPFGEGIHPPWLRVTWGT